MKLGNNGWHQEQTKQFEEVKLALANATKLNHPDENKFLCLFTDASEESIGLEF